MALKLPFAGFLFMHRLIRSTVCSRGIRVKLLKCRWEMRSFSRGSVKWDDIEGDKTPPNTKMTFREAQLSRRRRPLSPLERISGLLPQDALSPEVMQLREQNQQDPAGDPNTPPVIHCTPETSEHVAVPKKDESEKHHISDDAQEPNTQGTYLDVDESVVSPTLPGESLLALGELLVAEYHKNVQLEFRKMFQLQTGTQLNSSWGTIQHDKIIGQPAGRFLKTSRGVHILIRRASLEDYVLYMKRRPTITYPKDAGIMLVMMDVNEGDRVLESGSGSGAMTLFLSRAVGSRGSVVSVEVREDHHKRAVLNYRRWMTSWNLRRGEEWPDNVQFHNADLCRASSFLAGQGFHAVALDLINPHLALPAVVPHLHPGAVCAIYLVNITQVVELLEGLRCSALPLLCERVIEVPIRNWLVTAAHQKDGTYCTSKAPILDEGQREDGTSDVADHDETSSEKQPAFGGVPYIARPHPEQPNHTAFLVKLRKCVR